jgi:hypothetical protein
MTADEKATILRNLKAGDYIAFEWKYGVLGPTIIVDNITSVKDNEVLVHFLYGYKSEAEYVKFDDIIAIGSEKGDRKIKGFGGKYIVIKEHELLTT